MIVETYDIISGDSVQRGSDLSIGDVIQGHHMSPVVFRCLKGTETSIASVTIALSDGGLGGNEYSYFISPAFIPNVLPGDSRFTQMTSEPIPVPVSGQATNYVWIDMKTDPKNAGPSKASFVISYDFS